jgi:hypothetical protein
MCKKSLRLCWLLVFCLLVVALPATSIGDGLPIETSPQPEPTLTQNWDWLEQSLQTLLNEAGASTKDSEEALKLLNELRTEISELKASSEASLKRYTNLEQSVKDFQVAADMKIGGLRMQRNIAIGTVILEAVAIVWLSLK